MSVHTINGGKAMQIFGVSLAEQWLPNSHEPVSNSHEPVSISHEPVSISHEPVSNSHEPVSISHQPVLVYLNGELGSGKTTLAQGILHGLGVSGAVTSPTYTLVEQYQTRSGLISHLDLYRLEQPSEFSALGFEDIYMNSALILIEWPDKAVEILPKPSYVVECAYAGDDARTVLINRAF